MKEFKELLEKVEEYCLYNYDLPHCDIIFNHDESGYVCRNALFINDEGVLFGFENINDLENILQGIK